MSPAVLRAQCDALRHRGPDDAGEVIDGDFAFGMRRLSIVDVSGGHQPFHSPNGRLSLVFNGEIYNFQALRDELEAAGRVFASRGDAEVVLAGYERWGDGVWARLDGMFVVAVWDRAQRRLTLVRDQMGIKPLYLTDQRAGFAFASELKALTAVPALSFDVDPRGVHDVFRFGHVRTPRSIYRQVRTLPPGHFMHVEAGGEPRVTAYHVLAYAPGPAWSEGEWVEAFRERWQATVAAQMVGEVEIGAFLSGGVDSSAVVAAMTRVSDRPVRTFTIGFPDPRYDESAHAEAVAKALGTIHTTATVDLADARDMLPAVAAAYDEPFADPAAVPTWYLARVAADHVKVALSGDGGDELFFGYKRHATERRIGALSPAARFTARGLGALTSLPGLRGHPVLRRWRRTARGAMLPCGGSRFFDKMQITSPALRRSIFRPGFFEEHEGRDGIARLCAEYFPDTPAAVSADTLEQFAWGDMLLNLPDGMLTKVDRASMAHSLEVRVPMLGADMVELALSMPASMKLRGRVGKHVVREAVGPWLPPGTFDRRKQGFQMPLTAWFKGDFGRFAEELWRDSGVRAEGHWRASAVDRAFADHRAGRHDHGRFLYALAVYCLWWSRAETHIHQATMAARLMAAA